MSAVDEVVEARRLLAEMKQEDEALEVAADTLFGLLDERDTDLNAAELQSIENIVSHVLFPPNGANEEYATKEKQYVCASQFQFYPLECVSALGDGLDECCDHDDWKWHRETCDQVAAALRKLAADVEDIDGRQRQADIDWERFKRENPKDAEAIERATERK